MSPIQVISQHPPGGRLWRWTAARHGENAVEHGTQENGTTRMDPSRDTLLVDSTPIDYLDFASPVSGLGSKMGLDATNKWPGETQREWGRPMQMSADVTARMEPLWQALGL